MRRFRLFLFYFFSVTACAQAGTLQDGIRAVQQDSVVAESPDTTRYRFMTGIGSMYQRIDSTSILHNSQFDWTDAKYLGDLLWKIPGFYLHDLGETGKFSRAISYAADLLGVPLLIDGRPIKDPFSGAINLYDIPLEGIEQVELLDGGEALLFGEQGAAINLVTRQYNNNRPITKLRYLQGPFEYGLTDGLFTQNVARGTNVMLGLQRHVSDGRFENSGYDAWNLRSQVRYNHSDRLNLALSYFYHSADNGLNDGIDTTSPSLFNEVTAIIRNADATESTSRHDLTLTGIATLFDDSSGTTQFSVYYTQAERSYNDADSVSETATTSFKGMRIVQHIDTKLLDTSLGADAQQADYSSNSTDLAFEPLKKTSLFAKTKLKLLTALYPRASLRIERTGNKTELSYGIGITSRVTDMMVVNGEYNKFSDSDKLYTAAVTLTFGASSSLTLTAFKRSAGTAPQFIPGPFKQQPNSVTTFEGQGGTTSIRLRWKWFEGFATGMFIERDNFSFPKWSLTSEVAFRDNILKDVMELRTGVRFKYASKYRSPQYVPQYGLYSFTSANMIDQSFTLDLFAIAHLGDAFLTLSWENLLNREYQTVSRYPMPGRSFRFGFNWIFID